MTMSPAQSQISPASSLRIEPVGCALGATIHGLDLDAIDPAVAAALTQALHEHGVLFYRGGSGTVTGAQFLGLAEALGDILVYPYRSKSYPTDDERLSYVDSDSRASKAYRTNVWHTDGTPEECPPQAALLNPVELPRRGGDTMWASMYAAYDSLSSHYQRFLDGLEALHTTENVARRMGEGIDRDLFANGSKCVHPVVLTDSVTGRRMLYVNENYTERLVGFSAAESDSVLRMLFDHVNTPEFHVRWQWQVNDIAVWEERVTLHRAVADYEGRRVLRRVALKGDRPAFNAAHAGGTHA
jgi:taurine dioxygenase